MANSEPSEVMLNLSALAYLLGLTIVTWCLTRATERHPVWLRKTWSNMLWSRFCLLMVLFDSWLYLITTGLLLFGAPARHGPRRCSAGLFMCITLYGASKVLVYLCLIERVQAVWGNGRKRRHTPLYIACLVMLLPIAGIAAVMIAQGVHYIRDGICITGISRLSSTLLISYDTCANLFLTVMFVAPLVRSTIRSPRLKVIATRASIATSIGLVTTVINSVILYVLDGKEMIWVCLGSCATDIVVNVVVLYWAMQGAGPPSSAGRGQSIHFSPLPHTNSVRPGAIQNEDMLGVGNADKNSVFLTTLPTHGQRRDDFSLGIVSSVSIPTATVTFQKPEPVFQSPHYSRSGPQPSPSQPSLASTIEQSIKPQASDSALVQKIENEFCGEAAENQEPVKVRRSLVMPRTLE